MKGKKLPIISKEPATMTTAIDITPRLFAVAHLPGTKRPYVVRTTEAEFAFARKTGSSKKIMELIEAGYTLDRTGQTRPVISAEGKYVVYDQETRDHAMYWNGQLIGFARTPSEADVTLDALVDEIARHTRATTADMAADAAAAQEDVDQHPPLGKCRICGAAAWRDAGPDGLLCPSHAAVLDEARAECPIPTRDALAAALDAAVTARLPIPRDTPEWDAAQAVVEQAHTALRAWPERVPQSPDDVPADRQLFTCDLCHELKSGAELTPDDGDDITVCRACADGRCPSCGDPSDGLCGACRESGEGAPYVALGEDPENAAAVSGACRACGGAHHIQACDEMRAALWAPERCGCGQSLADDGMCDACSALSAEAFQGAAPAQLQANAAALARMAAPLSYDKGAAASETIPEYIARRTAEEHARIRAACEAADEAAGDTAALTRMAADDPCADVRARLGEENEELRRLLADHHLWIECALKALQHWMAPVTFDAASKLLQD